MAPIAASQVEDLLSENADPNEFPTPLAKIEPTQCAAVVQEVRAPFIFDAAPAAHSGGYWVDEDATPTRHVVEIVGVYHSDYDAAAALAGATRTIESCRNDRIAAGNDGEAPDVIRAQLRRDSGSPQIARWSLAYDDGWACDDAFVAAHNAAIEITACGKPSGYDVLGLARDALSRIEALADMTK